VCVVPHWMIEGDRDGRWSVSMDLILTCEHEPNSRSSQLAVAYGR
jgi:hypothetical protein